MLTNCNLYVYSLVHSLKGHFVTFNLNHSCEKWFPFCKKILPGTKKNLWQTHFLNTAVYSNARQYFLVNK